MTLRKMKFYREGAAEPEGVSEVLVNGVLFSGDCINEPGAVVEIKVSWKALRILSPKEVIIDDNRRDLYIYGERIKLLVKDNQSDLHVYGNHADVTIEHNDCNLHLYGNYLNITVHDNSSNLHIFGDFTLATVEDNDCNLHFHGNHNRIEFTKKCRAMAYGDYMKVTLHPLAEIQLGGCCIEQILLSKPPRKKRAIDLTEPEK